MIKRLWITDEYEVVETEPEARSIRRVVHYNATKFEADLAEYDAKLAANRHWAAFCGYSYRHGLPADCPYPELGGVTLLSCWCEGMPEDAPCTMGDYVRYEPKVKRPHWSDYAVTEAEAIQTQE